MSPSVFLTALLALLLFAQGFSYPHKDEDYHEDPPGDDDEPADSDTTNEQEAYSKPARLLSRNATLKKFPGDTIYLPCSAINADDVVHTWKKGDSVIFLGGLSVDNPDESRISLDANNTLVIRNAKEQDSEAYSCSINVGPGQAPEVIYRVIIHPSNSVSPIKVSPGNAIELFEKDNIILTCSVDLDEEPHSIIWSLEGQNVFTIMRGHNAAEVHIKNANRHHAGMYQCLADLGPNRQPLHSVVNVTVKYAPEVEVVSDYVHSAVDQSINLNCIVHANPPAEVSWFKLKGNDQYKVHHMQHTEVIGHKKIHNLILKNIQKSDFGKYICSARNLIGNHSKQMELSGAPGIAKFNGSYFVDNDRTIVLNWEVESYLPIKDYEVRYRKNEKNQWTVAKAKVTPGNGGIKYMAEFAIQNLQPHTYDFQLRSMNDFGWSPYSMQQRIDGQYNLQTAGIGLNAASVTQPIMFWTALLLVVSCFTFKNL